jgi:glycosyltransferase involved in cell wall biosynthesis
MSRLHLAVDGSGLARPWAGVGSYTRHLLRAMAAARPDSCLTVYAPAGAAGVPGVALRAMPSLKLVGRHLLWPLALRRLRADLYFGCAGQLPLGGVGMPSVVTAHDLAIYRHPEWFPSGQWLSVKVVVPGSLRRANTVIAVSHHTARDLSEVLDIPRDRIRVVHLGADPACHPLRMDHLRWARAQLGLPQRFILFVGTIEPRKNLPTLLDAWEQLDDRPDLVLAGGWGWRTEEIEARLGRARSGVRALGPVPAENLPLLYNLATCLAHPAWYEGFGLTPLEAMACGTPVVVSNSSSLPEVVGRAGLLVDPADVDGWTAALRRVVEDADLRARLREEGLNRAAQLTWERSARETWQVMDMVLGPRSE